MAIQNYVVHIVLFLATARALFRLLVQLLQSLLAKRNIARRNALIEELTGRPENYTSKKTLVGLFHPYCNAGGGGERVLWAAIACMQREEPNVICVVYTGDVDASKQEIVDKVKARFSISFDPSRLYFVYLKARHLVEDTAWKHFTLLGQSLGSVVLAHQAMATIIPDVFIDTMGYAFTFPLVKLYADIPVGAYIHYPTISTNMLERVKKRSSGHTNASFVAGSTILSTGKLVYYIFFAKLYAFSLRHADFIMTNSSWTQAHINKITGAHPQGVEANPKAAKTLFPSCDTISLSSLSLEDRECVMLSVAQFRPEKEHATQLKAFKAYLDVAPTSKLKLIMAGSVRNKGDEDRVDHLKALAKKLGLQNKVKFVVNPPWTELVNLFGKASIGLSTMVDEHFGINVVEFLAAGLIPLVHASGGPLLDIVVEVEGQPTGYHASTPEDYAEKLQAILALSNTEQIAMRKRGRALALTKFSEAQFDKGWLDAWRALSKRGRTL